MGRNAAIAAALAAALCGCFTKPPPPNVTADAPPPAVPMNVMLVSAMTVDFGMLNGTAGGDYACQRFATAAGLSGSFVAWLSMTGNDAVDRLPAATTGWVRTDGKPFAMSRADLIAGHVLYPPALDEHGNQLTATVPSDYIATGTDATGRATGTDCSSYTTDTGMVTAGDWDGGTDLWTAGAQNLPCGPYHLACFGTSPTPSAVSWTPASGPRAFVTKAVYPPTLGVAGMDAMCQTEAGSQKFVALVASSAGPALTHALGPPATPWVRFDGVSVTQDFLTMTAPLDVTADGTYIDDNVYTGASTPTAALDLKTTCNDWSSGSGSYSEYFGVSARSLRNPAITNKGFDSGLVPCNI